MPARYPQKIPYSIFEPRHDKASEYGALPGSITASDRPFLPAHATRAAQDGVRRKTTVEPASSDEN